MKESRGISTFIATLLLMVLAVSAGVVIYAYTMGYLGGFGGTEQLGAISADENAANEAMITVYVRNIGKTTVNITRAYVDGDLYSIHNETQWGDEVAGGGSAENWVSIDEGNVEVAYIDADDDPTDNDDFTAGNTYEVKLIAADNTQLSISVKAK
jgi:hypothetical protein